MKTSIFDTSRIYVLVSGGDGYETSIVSGDKLEEAYLSMFYTDAKNCPENERYSFLEALRDEDNWTHNYAIGPVCYSESLEDGSVQIILLSNNAPQNAIAALVRVARAAWHAADDSEEIQGDNDLEYRVPSSSFDELSNALNALDDFPDDKPGYVLSGPAKAEWVLRDVIPL